MKKVKFSTPYEYKVEATVDGDRSKNDKEEAKRLLKQKIQQFKDDAASYANGVSADFKTKELIFKKEGFFGAPIIVVPFSSLVSFHINQRGKNVNKKHGITRAVVGGALLGGVGAIVGATTGGKQYDVITELSVSINLSNPDTTRNIKLINTETKASSFVFTNALKQAEAITSLLERVAKVTEEQKLETVKKDKLPDAVTEIKRFKKLLDDGVLTQEEFNAKKKQLLGL